MCHSAAHVLLLPRLPLAWGAVPLSSQHVCQVFSLLCYAHNDVFLLKESFKIPFFLVHVLLTLVFWSFLLTLYTTTMGCQLCDRLATSAVAFLHVVEKIGNCNGRSSSVCCRPAVGGPCKHATELLLLPGEGRKRLPTCVAVDHVGCAGEARTPNCLSG